MAGKDINFSVCSWRIKKEFKLKMTTRLFSKNQSNKSLYKFYPELRDFDPLRVRSAKDLVSSQFKINKTFFFFFSFKYPKINKNSLVVTQSFISKFYKQNILAQIHILQEVPVEYYGYIGC